MTSAHDTTNLLLQELSDAKNWPARFKQEIESGADISDQLNEADKKIEALAERAKEAMSKAVSEGERMKQKMVDEAKQEGQKMISDAKQEIENEKNKAIEDVKDTIVDISIMAAEKAIKKKITKKEQLSVVNKHLKDIGKNVG